jgi:hypothetical protein
VCGDKYERYKSEKKSRKKGGATIITYTIHRYMIHHHRKKNLWINNDHIMGDKEEDEVFKSTTR